MKKIFASIALAVVSLTANAQVFIGGETGFWRDHNANETEFSLIPEFGYSFNDKWTIATSIGYTYNYEGYKSHAIDGTKTHMFEINPYARWTFAHVGPLSFFLDGGVEFGYAKTKDVDDTNTLWGVGIKPGLAVNLTKKLSFVTHVGFLGYRDSDNGTSSYDGFGYSLSGNSLTFGVYYNF